MKQREETPAYRTIWKEMTDMRNDLSFYFGSLPRGGPEREEWANLIRAHIRGLGERLARMERDGERYLP